MSKRLIVPLLAFLVLATPACSCDGGTPPLPRIPSPTPSPTPEMITLTLRNESSKAICNVYASPLTSETWGDDVLGGKAIAPGSVHTFDVPADTYNLRAGDCDGHMLVVQEDVDLHRSMEWTLNDAVLAGGLDFSEDPRFGEVDLDPDLAPDPYAVDLAGGGDVEVALLNLGADCAGFASSAPDFRMNWWGDSGRLRVFFVASGGGNATLIVSDPDENWLCNDDFTDDGFDPMIEIEDAASGQYDVWVGSDSPDQSVAGALYITGMDYRPDNLP